MSRGEGEVLFAAEGLRATFRDAGAPERPLVVTFDSLSVDLRLDRPGFGEAWLAQNGYDAVHVVSSRNAWYQDRDMPALVEAVRSFGARGRRVVTYGSSMGGYAAVRFAGRLGAQAAVALSPQVGIDPAVAPWETRWTEYAYGLAFDDAGRWTEERPDRVFVLYDPANTDRLHAEALAASHQVVAVPVPHAGHPTGTFLAEAGLLSDTVQSMIEDRFDPQRFRARMREGRRRSAAYHARLAEAQPPRRAALALRLAREAARLSPGAAAYHVALAKRLADTGDRAAAEASLRRAYARAPDDPIVRLHLAESVALGAGGGRAEVEALVRGLERLGAAREWMFVRACDLLFAAGAFAAARNEARSALRRLPRSQALRRRAWALGALLALPGLGPATLRRLRPWLVRRRSGTGGREE